MSNQVVNIHIFGRTLKLSCPSDQVDALNLAAKDLDERLNVLRRKTQNMNSDQLIMTAALNISYELTKEKLNNNELNDELNYRLALLQDQLEEVLNINNQ